MEVNTDYNYIFMGNTRGVWSFYEFNDNDVNNIHISKKLEIGTDEAAKAKVIFL